MPPLAGFHRDQPVECRRQLVDCQHRAAVAATESSAGYWAVASVAVVTTVVATAVDVTLAAVAVNSCVARCAVVNVLIAAA